MARGLNPFGLVFSASLLSLAGCPADGGEGTTENASGEVGDPTENASGEVGDPPQTADCSCFANYPGTVFIENSCAEVSLCPPIAITCSREDADCPVPQGFSGPPDVFEVNDEADLDCVLRALRDGTPGTLRWSFWEFDTLGQYSRDVVQHIAADRVVFATAEDIADQGGKIEDATQQILQPTEYFTGCLEETDIRVRALCLTATTTRTVTATCAEGGWY